jgi:hypothetical protein
VNALDFLALGAGNLEIIEDGLEVHRAEALAGLNEIEEE